MADIIARGMAANKADLVNGKVPASQLPSYVDDIIEVYTRNGSEAYSSSWFSLTDDGEAITPESGKIYIVLSSGVYQNKTYRWSGSTYAEVSPSLVLGETSTTAFRGDYGKTAYDHSLLTSGNPHNVTKTNVGLGNVTNDAQVKRTEIGVAGGVATYNSTLQLKNTTTLASPVTTINISTDSLGNALNLKRVMIMAYFPAATQSSLILMRINGITSANYYFGSTVTNANTVAGNLNTGFARSRIYLDVIGTQVDTLVFYSHVTNAPANTTPAPVSGILQGANVTSISSISFLNTPTTDFPVGTIIEVWGVNA